MRIGQVLRNLLTNAAKFSDPHAPIDVSISGEGDGCGGDVIYRPAPDGIGSIFTLHLPAMLQDDTGASVTGAPATAAPGEGPVPALSR